ncbi:MAG: hypothetical protein HY646_11145 [Acidobacteria bacterium]|nr:hypothetical protein [Acidobacteriota bacterium]
MAISSGESERMIGAQLARGFALLLVLGWTVAGAVDASAQAIIAPGGRTLFNRATQVRSFVEINHTSVSDDGNSVDVTQYAVPLAFAYGVYPKWTVILAQPYVAATMTSRTENQTTRQTVNGLADMQLFVQYDGFYSRNTPGGLTRLSGLFGLRPPTGARRFSTRATEYVGGLIFEKAAGLKYVLTSDFQYTFATENPQGVGIGDRAQFDFVPAYFLISRDSSGSGVSSRPNFFKRLLENGAYLILELNGSWQGYSRRQGNEIANTGGTTISISPGIQYFPSRSFLIEFSSPIAAIKALNGDQPEPGSRFLVGFRYLF